MLDGPEWIVPRPIAMRCGASRLAASRSAVLSRCAFSAHGIGPQLKEITKDRKVEIWIGTAFTTFLSPSSPPQALTSFFVQVHPYPSTAVAALEFTVAMGYLPCKLCALIATIIGIGTVPVAEAGTSAQAVPTPTSGVTPVFEFNNITNMTFCAPAVISWQYHPDTSQDPFDVSLAIWNESTAQTLPFLTPYENRTSSMRRTTRKLKPSHNHIDERKKRSFNTTSQMITPSLIDPVVGSFTWGKVNVTTGWMVPATHQSDTNPASSLAPRLAGSRFSFLLLFSLYESSAVIEQLDCFDEFPCGRIPSSEL
ncbi:hypothetical protein R3P38DRAFT_1314421 [Favolaschia claudopus]|uniref:Uncharacterized protein n=1 Tax=Favolaschia claudopus TaxID=2862362 RepID=A0AAW0AWZ8_9AGAR